MWLTDQERRKLLFEIYSKNLLEVEPGTKDTFRCPLCLKDFDRSALNIDQMLTLGHIIPWSVDGKICRLECGACNSKIGSSYDEHAANMRKAVDWASRKVGTKRLVDLRIGGKSAAAIQSYEDGPTAVFKAVDWADPNYKALMEEWEPKATEPGGFSLNVSFNTRSSADKRIISAVHAAFLMMFYCFGYEYALSPEADIVRKIINEGKAQWPVGAMEGHMPIVSSAPVPSAGVLRSPEKMKSFVVLLPCFYTEGHVQIVFLPGFNSIDTFKNFINSRVENKGEKLNFNINVINEGPLPRDHTKAFWKGAYKSKAKKGYLPARS